MKNNYKLQRKVLLFLLLAVACFAKAQQWKELNTGVTEDLYGVCCIDTNTVFVCGQNGVILKTINGGGSWEKQYEYPEFDIKLIAFADEQTGYSYGHVTVINNGIVTYQNRQLLKTTDGGATWMELGDPFSGFPSNVASTELYCLDPSTILLSSYAGIRKSSDGGLTFRTVSSASGSHIYFDDNVGYVIDGNGYVFKTTDFGETWIDVYTCGWFNGILALNFVSKDSLSIFGAFEEIYNRVDTNDGFETVMLSTYTSNPNDDIWLWEGTMVPTSDYKFTTNQNGCFVSSWADLGGHVYSVAFTTEDGGNLWSYHSDGINWRNTLLSIDGADTIYFIAATNGMVYKTGTPDVIYPWSTYEKLADESVVFPNPIENQLNIHAEDANLVEVLDETGRKLFSIEGKDCFNLDTSMFDAGLYFVRIKNKEGVFYVKKVIKLTN